MWWGTGTGDREGDENGTEGEIKGWGDRPTWEESIEIPEHAPCKLSTDTAVYSSSKEGLYV